MRTEAQIYAEAAIGVNLQDLAAALGLLSDEDCDHAYPQAFSCAGNLRNQVLQAFVYLKSLDDPFYPTRCAAVVSACR